MATDAEQKSLYERLGGIYPISAVVDDFIDRIMVDPRLNANPKVDERLPPREHAGLARELPRPLNGDDLLALRRLPDELDGARRDDEEGLDLVSRRHQHLSLANRSDAPMGGDARDLLRRQRGKDLIGGRGERHPNVGIR